ncbi:serine/threonine protein kinase [Kribbella shirazensis]|uniref:Serine/threonine-protein kinase n=1 Tax=Kribbella shirazensis TaxID=1105143 RepID=A0A7X5VFT8_9ACTN|nr:serine/threonine protein kinase [Kribbella shirazensis]NIK60269.1 serine/threonine-protein kinase [Kribbella shirazensis]
MFPAEIDVPPLTYLDQLGTIFTRFGTQDSGNISYGVQADGARYFVKTAGDPTDSRPYVDFDGRVALLRTAAELARSVTHHTMPGLHTVVESPAGPLLVYEWRDGDLLGEPAARERFQALPTEEILAALHALYELHAALDAAGWVEGDFYDGAMLYDFDARRLTVMDLDTYHRGPYRNTMGRMFGSSRFMAPEEHALGAPIDSRTTAYVMARTALVLLPEPPPALHAVLLEATTTRFPSYQAFYEAWLTASSTTADNLTNRST